MDGWPSYPNAMERGPHQAPLQNSGLTHQFRFAGSHEHEMLIAHGHYRCPHCRRADTTEARGISRR